MRIGIDARFYSESGVGRYLRNLISHLQVLDKENQYFIFLLSKDLKQFKQTKNFQGVCADFSWYGFAEQFKLPKLLSKFKLDLAHFPHFNAPIFYSGKFVVTIHDLIHQHHSMNRATTLDPITYKIKQLGYRRVFKTAIKNSEKILVPSNYVKNTLVAEWKVAAKKVVVTYEAVDDNILNLSQKLNSLSWARQYIFYVGNAHPHKNVEGLIGVFLMFKKKYQYLQLVLSGHDHYFWERIKKEFQHEDIIYTGRISDEQLVTFYKGAEMFVMPSFEEGFGIPILEAMAGGCPVVSSNKGALMEIGGDACLYFDPFDMGDMGDKIERILSSEQLRQDLIKKGKKRYRQFSWESLAKQTLEVYQQCV